jgi:hypothetical protein
MQQVSGFPLSAKASERAIGAQGGQALAGCKLAKLGQAKRKPGIVPSRAEPDASRTETRTAERDKGQSGRLASSSLSSTIFAKSLPLNFCLSDESVKAEKREIARLSSAKILGSAPHKGPFLIRPLVAGDCHTKPPTPPRLAEYFFFKPLL